MTIWVILFLLIIAISFILAIRSMKDFQEIPGSSDGDYSLFLIRQSFDAKFLDSLWELVSVEIVSIERLFKGKQSAWTIFGPKKVLSQFINKLNLLELEDYTAPFRSQDLVIWEVGLRGKNHLNFGEIGSIFPALQALRDEDQFLWQVILRKGAKSDGLVFQTQIRAGVYCQDPVKRKELVSLFQNLNLGGLTKVPRPYLAEQLLDFYRLRALGKDSKGPSLSSDGVMHLLKFA